MATEPMSDSILRPATRTEAEALTPAEFWDRCNGAPWFYDYIDNHEAYDRGRRAIAALRELSKQSPEHEAIYAAWKARDIERDSTPPRPADKPAGRTDADMRIDALVRRLRNVPAAGDRDMDASIAVFV